MNRAPRYRRYGLAAAAATALVAALVAPTTQAVAAPVPPGGGSLGENAIVLDPSMPKAQIQDRLNALAQAQAGNEFGPQRYAVLFKPGTYGTAADPLVFPVGFYESVAGLGRNPGDVVINGSVNVYNQCVGGDQSQCYATTNFWRSLSNLTVNVAGQSGCYGNTDFWAVSQAAPLRRVRLNGNVTLMDYCTGSPSWASGGFIADSEFTGATVVNGSQQQFFTRTSSLDGWSNGVWNQVFCGTEGAPAQSFSTDPAAAPYTTLDTCPVTREAPYLYLDDRGRYRVFVPAVRRDSRGTSWADGATPGRSISLDDFYVVRPGADVKQINAALKAGRHLLLTPGVHQLPDAIKVTRPGTQVVGLGFATLVPTKGNAAIKVDDVDGVNVSGLIIDAGEKKSKVLMQVGDRGSDDSHRNDPIALSDVFFRVGGALNGAADTALEVNSDDTLIDDAWIWRADHGAGGGTWTGARSDTGLVVNGDRVTATGLAVEHFQKTEVEWNGEHGKVVFFQNENPYDVPNQAAWMASKKQKGYPAFAVGPKVKTFEGWGMGSYSYFNQGVDIRNSMAFQAPSTPGVTFHDLLTVFLNGSGGIDSVINGTGRAVDPAFGGPSNVVSYP
ncbi:hypothetical protein K353_01079 [Kitasatospora sp. SolWspMP-SS2h]|uniref:hypothetical protein n=1 Tax=Kitasatospora sp. SolWspMP-SS2h TaxID=1305729 RepID=UPI000DB90966|nr:hypothetical protein [Kitasatospora sp. SolWspMP-SS2h]RAJ45579.1 hypothetical protein K353_01079 [Kitasatospora sp. SolWspMP-SS2h]